MLRIAAFIPAAVLLCATAAFGQASAGAGTALQDLIHGAQGDASTQPLLAPAISRLIATEIGTFPIASSSSGFTYTFDPLLGIPGRSTPSFGPLFLERPETAGRGKWAIGFNVQHTNWVSIDGLNLANGALSSVFYDMDDQQQTTQGFINLSTTTAVFAATVGVTDRIDVGVGIPLVSQSVSGRVVSTYCANRSVSGTSTGVGDVSLHAKVRIAESRDLGLAGAVEARLPTGDDTQLLGVGRAQCRVLDRRRTIRAGHNASGTLGTFAGSGRRNTGTRSSFAAASTDIEPSDELNYSAGFDVAPHGGSHAERGFRWALAQKQRASESRRRVSDLERSRALPPRGRRGDEDQRRVAMAVTASVLFPLSNDGLKPGPTPMVGIERAFWGDRREAPGVRRARRTAGVGGTRARADARHERGRCLDDVDCARRGRWLAPWCPSSQPRAHGDLYVSHRVVVGRLRVRVRSSLGVPARTTHSFGPLFVERPQTAAADGV
jgi:hypothetical protein